jgi:hypothetical protein
MERMPEQIPEQLDEFVTRLIEIVGDNCAEATLRSMREPRRTGYWLTRCATARRLRAVSGCRNLKGGGQ